MSKKIAYEPHPVSPERRAELIAQGFKIIDAVFKPADEPASPAELTAPPVAEPPPVDEGVLPEAEQRAALLAELEEAGVEYDESVPTDELRALSLSARNVRDGSEQDLQAPKRRGRPPKARE